MENIDRKKIIELYNTLPQSVAEVYESEDIGEKILQIGRRHNLPVDDIGALSYATGLVMLGALPTREYVSELKSSLGISEETAVAIAHDINTELFAKIREDLKRIHGIKTNEPLIPDHPLGPLPAMASGIKNQELGITKNSEMKMPEILTMMGEVTPEKESGIRNQKPGAIKQKQEIESKPTFAKASADKPVKGLDIILPKQNEEIPSIPSEKKVEDKKEIPHVPITPPEQKPAPNITVITETREMAMPSEESGIRNQESETKEHAAKTMPPPAYLPGSDPYKEPIE